MKSTKTQRRKPRGPEYLPAHHLSRVPQVISARVETMISSVASHNEDDIARDRARNAARERLKLIHFPRREGFERQFLIGRLGMPEVKIDRETSRVYLAGASTPDRTERHVEKRPVEDQSDMIAEQFFTQVVDEHKDIVVGYTEVSLAEFEQANEKKNQMGDNVRHGLGQFFRIPPSKMTGLVLALQDYSLEQLESIGYYALHEKGMV